MLDQLMYLNNLGDLLEYFQNVKLVDLLVTSECQIE
jgi:hypothetical protein